MCDLGSVHRLNSIFVHFFSRELIFICGFLSEEPIESPVSACSNPSVNRKSCVCAPFNSLIEQLREDLNALLILSMPPDKTVSALPLESDQKPAWWPSFLATNLIMVVAPHRSANLIACLAGACFNPALAIADGTSLVCLNGARIYSLLNRRGGKLWS